eukprot:CCRYP_005557-RA/>CCRYP_005557-RA protein AED:0.23 eAED:0.23 QI:248/1/1/1/0/0/2/3364/905
MTRPSSPSSTFTLITSVACCLLHGDMIATNKVAALINFTPYSTSRRKSNFVRRLYQRRGYGDEFNDPANFYQDDSGEPLRFNTKYEDNNNDFYYADSIDQYAQRTEVDFDATPDYRDPTTRSRIKARKNKNNFSDGIDSIMSKVFSNTQKQQSFPMQPTNAKSSSIPHLSQMISISNEDMEKFAKNAKAGGKVVSNFVRGAILNTAKLAIEVLEQNNNNSNNNNRNKTQGRNTYDDVCDFDDDLCREIEDALAASSLIELTEGKDKDPLSNFNAVNRERDKPPLNPTKDNRVDKSSGDSNGKYFSNPEDRSKKFEEYYRRSLEEQLSEWDGQQKIQDEPRTMRQQTRTSWNDTALIMPDDRDLPPPPLDPPKRVTRQEQVSRSQNEPQPLLKKKRKEIVGNKESNSNPIVRRVDDRAMGYGRNGITDDYAQLFNAIQDAPYDEMRDFFDERETRVNSRRKKRDGTPESRYEAQDSVKVDITDEALAFARSLDLDVYEIYLSRDTMDEDAVLTLEDVLEYYDRMKEQMRVRPAERSTMEDRQRKNDDSGYSTPRGYSSNEQMGVVEPKVRLVNDSYNSIVDDPRERRSGVTSDPRRSGKITPSVRYRHVSDRSQQTKAEASPPEEEERIPRFRHYPELRNASSTRLRPSVRRNVPAVNPTVQTLGGSRREITSQSSLSQLIDYNPERNHEYNMNARGVPRENRFSTVPLAKLVQNPNTRRDKQVLSPSLNPPPTAPLPFDQISTAQFREPYQGRRIDDIGSRPNSQHLSEGALSRLSSEKRLQPSMYEQKPRVAPQKPASSPFTKENESAYCTNDALLIAEKYGVDLRKVAAGSDEPISAEDVRHYIESRKSIRASSRKDEYGGKRDSSPYIDNELTYEEFASYFDTDTIGRLQRLRDKDSREMIE